MDEPKMGDKAICSMCDAEIEYIGPYWRHTGKHQPRHPATPKQEGQAPLQPIAGSIWAQQLSPRELIQVEHALDYESHHSGAGIPGHNHIMLIAKLARLLDAQPKAQQSAKTQKIVWSESNQCWCDVITGVRVDPH